MADTGIIGGTGLTAIDGLEISEELQVATPFGSPSGVLRCGSIANRKVVFLPRHGSGHTIPPHKVNYRANLWALREVGVRRIVAIAAVGGIRDDLPAGTLVVPDQIIDYTWSRQQTFFEEDLQHVVHVDFTEPYTPSLRQRLLRAGEKAGVSIVDGATYGATQGPRLESAAEILRLERDGCDLVGMTGMPEAGLARELGLDYAACAVVANRAAGKGDGEITMSEIEGTLREAMVRVTRLLREVVVLAE